MRNVFLVLFLVACAQKTILAKVPKLQELCAECVVQNIDVHEFMEGLISRDAGTLEFLDRLCQINERRRGFAKILLHNVFAKGADSVYSVRWGRAGTDIADGLFENIREVATVDYKVLEGHTGAVNSVAWSPDSKSLASVSVDKTVKIWDVETGIWSYDETVLDYVGIGRAFDYMKRKWNWIPGKCKILNIDRHCDSVAWHPDGKSLGCGITDGTVILCNIATGECKVFAREKGVCAWSPDGTMFASGSIDRTVRVWNVATGECIRIFTGHEELSSARRPFSVASVEWSPDGTMIASGTIDGTVRLCNIATGECKVFMQYSGVCVTSLAWSPDGAMLVCATECDGSTLVWNVVKGKFKMLLSEMLLSHNVCVSSVAWSPNGKYLACGLNDGTIKVWRKIIDFKEHLELRRQLKQYFTTLIL